MKVIDHLNAAKSTLFSFEILPPLKGKSIQSIYDGIDPLMEFKPKYINVTYHREEYVFKERAKGLLEKIAIRKRPGTVGICAAIMNKYHVDAVPHLICGGFSKDETENALIDLQFLGIEPCSNVEYLKHTILIIIKTIYYIHIYMPSNIQTI